MADVHTFDNGIKVFEEHLIDKQRERYETINLHEPEEEEWITKLVRAIGDGPRVFVDIGAAVGYYCFLVQMLNTEMECHAYEPLPDNREKLAANSELNGLGAITVHDEAVSEAIGKAHLDGGGFVARLHKQFGMVVPTTTIDAIVEDIGRPIDLMKIDIQGAEVLALAGASQALRDRAVANLVVGTHGPEIHDHCLAALKSKSYRILHEAKQVPHQPDGIIIAATGKRKL